MCFPADLPMGYPVKIQKVERPTNRSYYVNFPVALAEAIGLEKGEDLEWLLEDKNTLILQRLKPKPPRRPKSSKAKASPKASP
jgi:bifunctional DNA-binding transcriptional regulator/antitoxin component of YhaV-PrlF toxin-antitoxin module